MNITENMSKEELDIVIEKLREGTLNPVEQLDLCRRRINNFRQTGGLKGIIQVCELEPLAVKMNKVSLNIIAMLHFALLSDKKVSAFMDKTVSSIYKNAFDRFRPFDFYGMSAEDQDEMLNSKGASFPTTVELNNFLHAKINVNVDRINNLPSSLAEKERQIGKGFMREDQNLYSAADIRERAIFYFAVLGTQEKMKAISEINMNYGYLMTRLNDKQYAKKRENLGYY